MASGSPRASPGATHGSTTEATSLKTRRLSFANVTNGCSTGAPTPTDARPVSERWGDRPPSRPAEPAPGRLAPLAALQPAGRVANTVPPAYARPAARQETEIGAVSWSLLNWS